MPSAAIKSMSSSRRLGSSEISCISYPWSRNASFTTCSSSFSLFMGHHRRNSFTNTSLQAGEGTTQSSPFLGVAARARSATIFENCHNLLTGKCPSYSWAMLDPLPGMFHCFSSRTSRLGRTNPNVFADRRHLGLPRPGQSPASMGISPIWAFTPLLIALSVESRLLPNSSCISANASNVPSRPSPFNEWRVPSTSRGRTA